MSITSAPIPAAKVEKNESGWVLTVAGKVVAGPFANRNAARDAKAGRTPVEVEVAPAVEIPEVDTVAPAPVADIAAAARRYAQAKAADELGAPALVAAINEFLDRLATLPESQRCSDSSLDKARKLINSSARVEREPSAEWLLISRIGSTWATRTRQERSCRNLDHVAKLARARQEKVTGEVVEIFVYAPGMHPRQKDAPVYAGPVADFVVADIEWEASAAA